MRRQRIDLGNTRHGSDERGAYRAAGTDKISLLLAVPHKLLGDHIKHGKAVFDDRGELLIEPRFHDFRQRIPVQ